MAKSTETTTRDTLLAHVRGFSVGAIAACCAVTFTNPWEVVKTRLQLQGEMEEKRLKNGEAARPRAYTSAPSAFVKICREEGLRGIQKGLAPAYIYQVLLNGTRLGFYEPIRDTIASTTALLTPTTSTTTAFSMILGGATSGILGACLASPLYLIKTRMQSYTPNAASSVGHQHAYVSKGTMASIRHIVSTEGVRGLWRGVDAAMLRTGIGSAVQLSSYDACKSFLVQSGLFDRRAGSGSGSSSAAGDVRVHFAASGVTSLLVCLAMNPFDVASTRMYNQHVGADGKTGSLYKSGIDCIVKTVKVEGLGALYKGFSAHYLRIGPHTILTFLFLEQTKKAASFFLDT